MTWEALFTLATVLALIVALVREIARIDITVLTTLAVLLIAGIIPPNVAFSGFSDPAVITVGALYVVAAGIHRTGVLSFLDRTMVSARGSITVLLLRLTTPTAFLSALLNNTPVVAMLMPRMQAVAGRNNVPVSKLLMPMSFAAIAGGMITLIGTSTNLVASGLLSDAGYAGFGLFEFAWIGLPAAAFVVLYLSFVGHRLIPHREIMPEQSRSPRRYLFELRIPPRSVLSGKTVAEAQLRALGDAYLVHIQREGRTIGPADPDEVLQEYDVLAFTGATASMERLLERTDLQANVDDPPLNDGLSDIPLFEAVISSTSSLVGRTLKEIGFRQKFQGIVLAIHRQDEHLGGALGNVALKPGDLLLIEAREGFDRNWSHSQGDFYLVSPKTQIHQPLSRKAPIALGLLVAMILLHVLGFLSLAVAAFSAALAMILTGCLRGQDLRKSIDMTVMLTIASAFGIGKAVEGSGLAALVGHGLVTALPAFGPMIVLAVLYVITVLLTEIITNSAAVVIMLPISIVVGLDLGVDPRAVALTVTIAASASFLSPLGYQTNLMVMGAGGYRFADYFRAGLPVSVGLMVITLLVVYLKWIG